MPRCIFAFLIFVLAAAAAYAQAPREQDLNRLFSRRVKVEPGRSPSRGNPAAQVTIVVFSDFECVYCRRAARVLDSLLSDYEDQVRVVYKNFPLPFHLRALEAAKAALAAGKQGKFWEMHNLLFDGQTSLGRGMFMKCAKRLDLDLERFEADLRSAGTEKAIQQDIALARQLGVTSAPTFILNGVVVRGAYGGQYFRPIIERLLLEPPPGTRVVPLNTAGEKPVRGGSGAFPTGVAKTKRS